MQNVVGSHYIINLLSGSYSCQIFALELYLFFLAMNIFQLFKRSPYSIFAKCCVDVLVRIQHVFRHIFSLAFVGWIGLLEFLSGFLSKAGEEECQCCRLEP